MSKRSNSNFFRVFFFLLWVLEPHKNVFDYFKLAKIQKNYMFTRKKKLYARPLHQTRSDFDDRQVRDGSSNKTLFFSLMHRIWTTAQSIKKTKWTKKWMAKNLCVFYEFRRRIQLLLSDEFIWLSLQYFANSVYSTEWKLYSIV